MGFLVVTVVSGLFGGPLFGGPVQKAGCCFPREEPCQKGLSRRAEAWGWWQGDDKKGAGGLRAAGHPVQQRRHPARGPRGGLPRGQMGCNHRRLLVFRFPYHQGVLSTQGGLFPVHCRALSHALWPLSHATWLSLSHARWPSLPCNVASSPCNVALFPVQCGSLSPMQCGLFPMQSGALSHAMWHTLSHAKWLSLTCNVASSPCNVALSPMQCGTLSPMQCSLLSRAMWPLPSLTQVDLCPRGSAACGTCGTCYYCWYRGDQRVAFAEQAVECETAWLGFGLLYVPCGFSNAPCSSWMRA